MLAARGKIRKVVILRPGALGDVLAVRGVIRFIKDAFPGVEVSLIAPGERGTFLCREGWADRVVDWERAAFSWLFSDGEQPPPPALRALFAGCDWLLCYVDEGGSGVSTLEARLETLAPAAGKVFCPSRPAPGHREGIGQWLARAAVAFCARYNFLEQGYVVDLDALAAARVRISGDASGVVSDGAPYAVLHPGSGDRRKNWPLTDFAVLGQGLVAAPEQGGEPLARRLVVTSGEADGDLGERLTTALPGAMHLHQPELETLATVLANARVYVGNDSGVSHLAAAVENKSGGQPTKAVIFGSSDSVIWAPPGARILRAGEDMARLSPEVVLREIAGMGGDGGI